MPERLRFDFRLGDASTPTAARRRSDGPMRILVIADFGGRGDVPDAVRPPLSARRPRPVDVDTFDARLRELAPSVRLPTAAAEGAPVTLAFHALDDFHPDRLCRRVRFLEELARLRVRLDDPASQAEAIESLQHLLAANGAPPTAVPGAAAATPATETDTDTIARLLGGVPETRAAAPPTTPAGELVRAVVAPHRVAPASPQLDVYRAALDELAGRILRRILQDPTYRALEATWRGLASLIVGASDDDLEWWMLDAAKAEVAQDLLTAGGDLSGTALHRLLVDAERGTFGGEPWSLLLGDYYFGPDATDARLLAALGTLAAACGGPFVAGAYPSLLGCRDAQDLADPARWQGIDPEAAAAWQALRQTRAARWLALALPRLLLRLPYGSRTEPIEAFAFDEAPDPADPAAFLWGSPGLAPALLVAQAFASAGWDLRIDALHDLEDLPAFTFSDGEGTHLLPCAEVALPDRAVEAILAQGLVVLQSHRARPTVRVPALPSLADPAAGLEGPWATR
jgi:type VI secretion system protein ImpC